MEVLIPKLQGFKLSKEMSRKRFEEPSASWGHGYLIAEDVPNRIIGNVLTLVEILGLSEKQEQPFKDLIRQRVWECIEDGVHVSPETHNKLRDEFYKGMEQARVAGTQPKEV